MYSFQNQNPQIITFVGRPTDSKKGLTLFFDALSIISKINYLPYYIIWIIGGSESEVEIIKTMICNRQNLANLAKLGRLIVFGRINNASLSEFYSRSNVTIMPSCREEFGIVAVESMMSGCPVIAANIGGLKNLIISGVTGHYIDDSDSIMLASVITGYLRNPDFSKTLGKKAAIWAKENFSQEKMYNLFVDLYKGKDIETNILFNDKKKLFFNIIIDNIIDEVESLIKEKIVSYENISTSEHICLKVTTSKKYFVKLFAQVPSSQLSVFPVPEILNHDRDPYERLSKTIFHKNNPNVPKLINYSKKNPLLITEWCNPILEFDISSIKQLIDLFRNRKKISNMILNNNKYFELLMEVRNNKDLSAIYKFDIASSQINSVIDGNRNCFYRIHPQVELLRLFLLLKSTTWSLPNDFSIRIIAVIEYLLNLFEFYIIPPTLCHGDLKPRHLFIKDGKILVGDLEQTRYTVGQFDEAIWIYNSYYRSVDYPTINTVFNMIDNLVKYKNEKILTLCWFISHSIYNSIRGYICGNKKENIKLLFTLKNFELELLKYQL